MDNRISRVVIVGGGTAGWMAAAYLNRHLRGDRPNGVKITLVESANVGVIGVGEATIPTLKVTLRAIGVAERDFMVRTNATFKNAIKFVNWREDPGKNPNNFYFHPFEIPPTVHDHDIVKYWLARRYRNGNTEDFAYACGLSATLCDHYRAPKNSSHPPYKGPRYYAYHLDAILLGHFLRDIATRRGVRHVVDDVVDVLLDERGYVRAVKTAGHGELEGDLFLDCTGFRGLIINEVYKTPFVDYTNTLFCDRAVALRIPYADKERPIRPFTTATAMSAGWIWEIDLYDRSGIGYVYSSQFISDDAAEQELRGFVGPACQGIKARRLRMRVGRNAKLWVKNCVSVGLAGGFIEPLESTGIYLTEIGLQMLAQHFPTKDFDPSLSDHYNQLMTAHYDEIRDFIVMHYCLTEREDTPFWKQNKYNPALSDELHRNLRLWRNKFPTNLDLRSPLRVFGKPNYTFILAGMNHLPGPESAAIDLIDVSAAEQAFASVKQKAQTLLTVCPDHREYVTALHEGAEVGEELDPRAG